MTSKHAKFVKIFPCFHNSGEQLSPDEKKPPAAAAAMSEPEIARSTKPMTTKQQAEAYIPSWQRLDVPERSATGRRKAASVSNVSGSDDSSSSSSSSRRHQRSHSSANSSSSNNMLYFGDGTSSARQKTYTPMSSTSSGGGGGGPGGRLGSSAPARTGVLAGRDASGYLATGVTGTSIMNGTYSSLTYGGSLQYNYAQNQSFGAGTGP